jgi:hypothetical protein
VALEKDPAAGLNALSFSPTHGSRRGFFIFVEIKQGQLPSPQKFLVERHARNEEADGRDNLPNSGL